ncbi:MAG: MurR/RpiR family transcriptional regulator [Geminicoccaceae bacterium]|nr:MurR/RpiR family transcriptional regulator [Geminicoccaceae bacterium]
MAPGKPLLQRILDAYGDMPRGERRLADLLLANAAAIVERNATELAASVGISKATAARFFRRLDYPSFRAAQADVRGQGFGHPPLDYSERFPHLGGRRPELSQHLESETANLIKTIEQQRPDELARAVRLMARAEKLWVVGFGDNYPLAHLARAQLIKIRSDIRMLPIGGFSMPEEFASITANDVMLALGVGRRTRALRYVVTGAIQAGARVIYLTDSSGLDRPGDGSMVLRCRNTSPTLFDSPTAAVSLIHYLCSTLAALLGESTISRLRRIDDIHHSWGVVDELPVN